MESGLEAAEENLKGAEEAAAEIADCMVQVVLFYSLLWAFLAHDLSTA